MSETPDLSRFLHESRWQQRFEEEVLRASAAMSSKVRGIVWDDPAPDSWRITAAIAGEEIEINYWKNGTHWDFESFCSCEGGFFCVHAAALLHRLEKDRRPLASRGFSGAAAAEATLRELRQRSVPSPPPPPSLPTISASPSFQLHVVRGAVDRTSKLLLQSLGQAPTDTWIFATANANYDGHIRPLRGSMPDWTSRVTQPDGRTAILQHDSAAENRAARELSDAGLSSLQSNPAWRFLLKTQSRKHQPDASDDRWFPDPSRIAIDAFWHQFRGESVAKLESFGWEIRIDDEVGHRVHDADPTYWQSQLDSLTGGWFSLSVGFDVGDERHDLLPILAKLLEGDFLEETLDRPDIGFVYAPLPNGDALRLPIGRVRRILHHLAALIDPKFPDRVRLHALDAAGLAGVADLGVDPPPELSDLAAKIRDFSGIDAAPPPAGLQAEMRSYQLDGFRWMRFLASHSLHGILADDMGLGKTLQTLAHILAEKESGASGGKPCLVVAPTSVVPNWLAEAKKFTPSLRVLVLNGPERRSYLRSIPYADLVLTSFALLHRDIDALAKHRFHLAVLDEAQNIKNPHAKVAQAACRLDAAHRLCLSGTPVENHLGELWSLMRFLIPGFLGSEQSFQDHFRKPIEKSGDSERNAELKRRIAPLILRRTKDQVAKELPPKTELVHLIELHTAQKDLYETVRATMNKRVRDAIAARGMSQFQMVFLDALLKLRQICCDPRLLKDDFATTVQESAKLDFLAGLLEVLIEEGRRILVFSQFTSMLQLIENHLVSKGVPFLKLTGASKDRGQLVTDFQSGRVPVFLISLKAGGTGLNLTAADTVIHYDPWWNPAAEAQATDRAYRIGQTRPVFVHKLLCQDTVEQRIHQLQLEKAKLAADLLGDADASLKLDSAMLQELLGG